MYVKAINIIIKYNAQIRYTSKNLVKQEHIKESQLLVVLASTKILIKSSC